MSSKTKQKPGVMKVTNAILVNELHPAIHTLGSLNIKSIDTLMNIAKFRKAVQDNLKMYSEVHKTISEADCEKDKHGHPVFEQVMTPKGPQQLYKYKNDQIATEVNQRINQLNEKEVEIPFTAIKSSDLKNVEGLNANVIVALGDFIEAV